MFDEFRELSDPPIDNKDHNTIKVQKRSKDIVKITVNLTVILRSYENTFCMQREQK